MPAEINVVFENTTFFFVHSRTATCVVISIYRHYCREKVRHFSFRERLQISLRRSTILRHCARLSRRPWKGFRRATWTTYASNVLRSLCCSQIKFCIEFTPCCTWLALKLKAKTEISFSVLVLADVSWGGGTK